MPTRIQQLSELYDRAAARLEEQHDAARSIARQLFEDVRRSFGIPADSKLLSACDLPEAEGTELSAPPEVAIEFAVSTNDEQTYGCGLILRIPSNDGRRPEVVLFRVSMRHVMNDRFEVRPFPRGTAVTCSASKPDPDALRSLSSQMFELLKEYFTATVKGDAPRAVGFQLVQETDAEL